MDTRAPVPLSLSLSPDGFVYLYGDPKNGETVLLEVEQSLKASFEGGSGRGLLHLGLTAFASPLPPSLSYWQAFSHVFVTEASKLAGLETFSAEDVFSLPLPVADVASLIERAPLMRGGSYLSVEVMEILWDFLSCAFLDALSPCKNSQQQDFGKDLGQNLGQNLGQDLGQYSGPCVQAYLQAHNPVWNRVGRVCFHLAENKDSLEHPFAFLATYTTRLSGSEKAAHLDGLKHLPLERALKDTSESMRSQLLALLLPVQKAAKTSAFIKQLVETGALFKPLSWTAQEAYQLLQNVPLLEKAGVVVKMPAWWNPKRPPRPQIRLTVGQVAAGAVGLNALLDFEMDFMLPDGEKLNLEELEDLLKAQGKLIQIKGRWVEVDSEKLSQVLSHWKQVERYAQKGLSFVEGLRLLSGGFEKTTLEEEPEDLADWSSIREGSWLNEALSKLRHPEQTEMQTETQTETQTVQAILNQHLRATLRPYQQTGVQWLWWLYSLRLGGCLADDMGLGKTIQLLALLVLVKHQPPEGEKRPSLLVLPASLLGNWQAEILHFAPELKVAVVHSSMSNTGKQGRNVADPPDVSTLDLVITTYAYVQRLPWLSQQAWNMVILDEAQCIKNPASKQTQAIKKLKSQVRFMLTGTPLENSLLDLWSLFDFVAPGLLGSRHVFAQYGKKTAKEGTAPGGKGEGGPGRFYAAVRHLVSPYLLRRLKSDKRIMSDLPDKTEVMAYCAFTKQQIVHYQRAVQELSTRLKEENLEGIHRRGLVLAYLTRFKQICNHPSQWLGHGSYEEQDSGKFIRLKEICETIRDKQEKVLIFTQFREIIPALKAFLSGVFREEGLTLDGQTAIKDRAKRVEAFQEEQRYPFFILSLKAGGTGLNLTRASHVIHFDRWWNPAVENQATDRAYRIGQKKNVLVHKFICQGTIEERIDAMLSAKKDLSDELLAQKKEPNLSELSNAELLDMVALDIHRVLRET
jgi:SNF2 family DNA or RNA helicase